MSFSIAFLLICSLKIEAKHLVTEQASAPFYASLRNFFENINEHESPFGVYESCPRHLEEQIFTSIDSTSCKSPLVTYIPLLSEETHIEVKPSLAAVKRCTGSCPFGLGGCRPFRKSLVHVPVFYINHLEGTTSCGIRVIEQHEECQCGCMKNSKHCNSLQEFNESWCGCDCKNIGEKSKCLQPRTHLEGRREWKESTCTCQCDRIMCPTNHVWVPAMCRCIGSNDIVENMTIRELIE